VAGAIIVSNIIPIADYTNECAAKITLERAIIVAGIFSNICYAVKGLTPSAVEDADGAYYWSRRFTIQLYYYFVRIIF
jgi:uncharacterized membrane protein